MSEQTCYVVLAKGNNGFVAVCATFASLSRAEEMKAVYDNIISNRGFIVVNGVRSATQIVIEKTTLFV